MPILATSARWGKRIGRGLPVEKCRARLTSRCDKRKRGVWFCVSIGDGLRCRFTLAMSGMPPVIVTLGPSTNGDSVHYYKRNIGDYAKKAGRLSMLQNGAYTLLIDACYDREQFPTRDEAIDWTWASSTAEIEAVDFVLSKFFTLEDGRYIQKRIQEEIAAYHETSSTNKRIAAEREAKRKESLTKRARSVNEAPPNQEPLTNNQEPKDIVVSPAAPPQGTRLDKGWTLPDDWKAWCTEHRPDLDPQSVADQFRDFWVAKPGKDGRKADWLATWRNWCRSQKPGAGKPRQNLTDEGYRDLMRGAI